MGNPELLAIYLRDHHAAAVGGYELARRVSKSNSDNHYGREAELLAAHIDQDRRRLEDVMDVLDVSSSRAKEASAWIGEKLGRLKLNGRVVSYSPLSRVVEFEGLTMAVEGKKQLWKALQVARHSDERLARFDFRKLIDRADEQLETLERLHRQAVEAAFVQDNGS